MAEMEKQGSALAGVTLEGNDFAALLKKEFKPKTDEAKSAVEQAVQTLAQQALANTALRSTDAVRTIEAMIAALDKQLTEQVNKIIHHEDFQKLESAWRGLHYLVNNTETDEQLKIRVMNVSKQELGKTLKRYKGTAWDQSPLFKKLYEEEYGQFGGEPYGALVGDYHFDHTPPDVELLGELSKLGRLGACAVHHRRQPERDADGVVAGARQPARSDQDLHHARNTPPGGRCASRTTRATWRCACRASWRACPTAPRPSPVDEFDFEEDTAGATHAKYSWANAAYAMAVNVNRSFKTYGWCSRIRGIESGGAVENLPTHSFPSDDGGVDMKCPTEIAISDRREAELSKNGFLSMIHRKNSDFAAFISGQSLQKPQEYDDPDATANAALAARLPYLFACNRFAHYLKCIVRDKVGSFRSRESMQNWLNEWILNYVDGDPANSSEDTKAKRPLAAAQVEVEEIEGSPGYYQSKFYLKPHYQLEGLTVSLRLVSKLPSEKTA